MMHIDLPEPNRTGPRNHHAYVIVMSFHFKVERISKHIFNKKMTELLMMSRIQNIMPWRKSYVLWMTLGLQTLSRLLNWIPRTEFDSGTRPKSLTGLFIQMYGGLRIQVVLQKSVYIYWLTDLLNWMFRIFSSTPQGRCWHRHVLPKERIQNRDKSVWFRGYLWSWILKWNNALSWSSTGCLSILYENVFTLFRPLALYRTCVCVYILNYNI